MPVQAVTTRFTGYNSLCIKMCIKNGEVKWRPKTNLATRF